jgi:hypothetical protein
MEGECGLPTFMNKEKHGQTHGDGRTFLK